MNEYVNAIYNTRQPNALKELLEKKKKDLDEALLTVITDTDMATDEKVGQVTLTHAFRVTYLAQVFFPLDYEGVPVHATARDKLHSFSDERETSPR